MPSDLQVSNIRDLTNANSAISIASDGQVTIAQNNPTITLGSNASVNTQDYFLVTMDGDQTVSDNTWVSVEFDEDTHDPNSWFNTSTYKFQPTKAGKYYVFATILFNSGGNTRTYLNQLAIGKNTTTATDSDYVAFDFFDFRDSRTSDNTLKVINIIDMNGSSDYLHVRGKNYRGGDGTIVSGASYFGAYKIGV